MSEMPVEDTPALADAGQQAAEVGEVVYLTERGQPLAAIVPAEESMRLRRIQDEEDFRKVLEGIADVGPRRVFESTEEKTRGSTAPCLGRRRPRHRQDVPS